MAKTKVLIAVKTYPTISTKYDELVCTAGFREDGTWVRIYPIQFRKKAYAEQYKKYDWVEVDLVKNKSDFRPESYRPFSDQTEIGIVGHIDTANNWAQRKEICLKNAHTNLADLIAAAKNKKICTSLAVFKPTEVKDFRTEALAEREWDKEKLASLRQMNLFDTAKGSTYEVVRKLPYKFYYVFADDKSKESKLMIEDWEIGQLYWNCLARHEGDEAKALADVRKKYFDDFAKTKDLHFFLGTTQAHHYKSHNPFIIIGTFHPKIETQGSLF